MIAGIKSPHNLPSASITVKTTLVSPLTRCRVYTANFVKMSRFEQRASVKFCFQLGKPTRETLECLSIVYGGCGVKENGCLWLV